MRNQIASIVFLLALACHGEIDAPDRELQAPVGAFRVTTLRCEHRDDPLGVDEPDPALSWRVVSDARGMNQAGYQILAARSPESLAQDRGDLWDSGRVASGRSQQVRYQGVGLGSSQQVFWKVRVWDAAGRVSAWSPPASWTMGILTPGDWLARWITGPTNQTVRLRREFEVRPGLRRAVMQVCGLGHYELTINGKKSGDTLLAPGWSTYDRTCLYETHDVTSLLQEGQNAVGQLLGNGMYNVIGGRYTKFTGSLGPLQAIGQLRVEYADGTVETVATDSHWQAHAGPITFSCVFGGEDHDARLETPGWDRPGFDAGEWTPAVVGDGPGGVLQGLSASAPPIREIEVLSPVAVQDLRVGVRVYDLGQNASIMPRLTVTGPRGATVRIVPSELVTASGELDDTMCGGNGYWTYTLSGEGREEWFPRFYYRGARYLQVEVASPAGTSPPVVESLEGVVVHSAAPPVGAFACSNDLFNRIHSLIRWAQRSNLFSVITDCPHREKLGWLEQYHLNGPSLRYGFDLTTLFAKGMRDMADSQLADGMVPNIAPEYVVFGQWGEIQFRHSPEWGSALILVPWQQYLFTGDPRLIQRHYPAMKRYLEYLGRYVSDGILSISGSLGDWYDIGPNPPGQAQLTPVDLTATAIYYADLVAMGRMATLAGAEADIAEWARQAAVVRDGFNRTFFDESSGHYGRGSQCASALALVEELVEDEHRDAVLTALVEDIRSRGNAVTAGDVGYRYVLRALADAGRSDVIFDMNNQSDTPGYGYQLKMGATSLTEAWDARRSSSQNHFMLGQLMEWFYHDLAGIQPNPEGPGFQQVIIRPAVVGDVTWVKAHHDSPYGRIRSAWLCRDGVLTCDLTIPANTTARVHIPTPDPESVREGGKPVCQAAQVQFIGREDGTSTFAIGSGTYTFTAQAGDGFISR